MNRHTIIRGFGVVLLGLFTGCAGLHGARGAMTSDSGGSAGSSDSGGSNSGGSSDSGGSSANSGGTSQNSADSSQGSVDATAGSGESSGGTFAQSTRESGESTLASTRQTTGPLLSTVAIGATVAGIGAIIWALQPAVVPAATPAAAAAFLRSHHRQLQQDLALGAGPAIEDLAHAANIAPEHLSRFGRLLRTHRTELLVLIDTDTLTPERAVSALQRIGELARTDPALARAANTFQG